MISHWRNTPGEKGRKAGLAGIKAFVLTRIGDIGLLIAIVLIYQELGSVDFQTISAYASQLNSDMITKIGILFLLAAFAKSAQIPFIPWLSSPDSVDIDAMQGPTTVSALIHAATMVKAGVYLISRLFLLLPLWKSPVFLWLLLLISGLTMLIAALSATVSFDLKRILAYSTVSQLSYMFIGLAIAFISQAASSQELSSTAFLSVQFHLISHAIFKSLLFLSAGYLIHTFGSQDIRNLRAKASWHTDPRTFFAFLIGGLGLAGVPPVNGYFSKEAIIGSAFAGLKASKYLELYIFAYLFSVITALITAVYVTRLLYYLFYGDSNNDKEYHSYTIMPTIMVIISGIAILGGLFQLILPRFFETIIGNAEFHDLFGHDIIHTVIMTALIPVIMLSSMKIFRDEHLIKRISVFSLIRYLTIAAQAGFYLENLWQGGLQCVKLISFRLRKMHTGSINDMILGGLMIVIVVSSVIVGGGI